MGGDCYIFDFVLSARWILFCAGRVWCGILGAMGLNWERHGWDGDGEGLHACMESWGGREGCIGGIYENYRMF